jgi:hypothetical protein
MPPLITPSPIILDQSFPRSVSEMRLALAALSEILDCLGRREAVLLLTEVLCEIAHGDNIEWERPEESYPLLRDMYQLFCQLFMKQHDGVVHISTGRIKGHEPHPVPEGCVGDGLVEIWADEMGRVLWLHDSKCGTAGYCIAVACACAFSGGELGRYDVDGDPRAFPLVGRDGLKDLLDAYRWDIHPDTLNQNVTFENAIENCRILGAIQIEKPDRGSHYKVHFKGGHKWVVDRNYEFVPDNFLKELIPFTGLPKAVIKCALIQGALPDKILTILM